MHRFLSLSLSVRPSVRLDGQTWLEMDLKWGKIIHISGSIGVRNLKSYHNILRLHAHLYPFISSLSYIYLSLRNTNLLWRDSLLRRKSSFDWQMIDLLWTVMNFKGCCPVNHLLHPRNVTSIPCVFDMCASRCSKQVIDVTNVLDKSKQSDELQRVPTCQSKLPAQQTVSSFQTGCFIGLIVNRRGEIDGVQMGVYVYRAKWTYELHSKKILLGRHVMLRSPVCIAHVLRSVLVMGCVT